jgi:hypothetical protein
MPSTLKLRKARPLSKYKPDIKNPTHLAVFTWWTVDRGHYAHIIQHRAIWYQKRVTWEQHPWSKSLGRDRGVDFYRHWSLETRSSSSPAGEWRPLAVIGRAPFRASGRTHDGYNMLPLDHRKGEYFDTYEEAREALIEVLRKRVDRLMKDVLHTQGLQQRWEEERDEGRA